MLILWYHVDAVVSNDPEMITYAEFWNFKMEKLSKFPGIHEGPKSAVATCPYCWRKCLFEEACCFSELNSVLLVLCLCPWCWLRAWINHLSITVVHFNKPLFNSHTVCFLPVSSTVNSLNSFTSEAPCYSWYDSTNQPALSHQKERHERGSGGLVILPLSVTAQRTPARAHTSTKTHLFHTHIQFCLWILKYWRLDVTHELWIRTAGGQEFEVEGKPTSVLLQWF